MSLYYPQVAVRLRVLWENFGLTDKIINTEYVLDVLSKRTSVNINDYTQADTADVEIEYKTFPFDPRTIRSVGVTVFMADQERFFKKDGTLNKIQPTDDNVIFQGFADEESIDLDDTRQTVRIECRDFTGLLIDAPFFPQDLPLNKSVDLLIEELMQALESVKNIKIDVRIDGVEKGQLPTLAKLAPDINKLSGRKNAKKGEKYWDVIQGLIADAGLIAFIEIDKLVITKPRTLYNKQNAHHFIFGRNLTSLNFKRKLGRQKGINVRVVSLDVERKQIIDAKIPEEASDAFIKSVGIAKARVQIEKPQPNGGEPVKEDAPFITFRVPNVSDKTHLISVGETIFEELGRQQIEGSFETKEMRVRQLDDDSNEVVKDLMKMRNGTPVRLAVHRLDMEEFSQLKSASQRARFLKKRGYPDQAAEALALTQGRLTSIFYTKSVSFTVDKETGFDLRVDFINFIEVSNRTLA